MKRIVVLLFIAAGFAGALFAQSYTLISPGDSALTDIEFILLESRNPPVSWTPPLSPHEIELMLKNVNTETLSTPAQEAYRRVMKRINPDTRHVGEYFSFSVHPQIQTGIRLRSNADIDWLRRDGKIPPLLSLPINFFFAGMAQLYVEPIFAVQPTDYAEHDKYFYTNIPLDINKADKNMPLKAFAALGGKWWNFQIGRDRLSFGQAVSGNLSINDSPDYYEFARLSVFSEKFKWSTVIAQMPLSPSPVFYEVPDDAPNGTLSETVQRYLYVHRLDKKPLRGLTIGITEGSLVGNNTLELRYLNPLVVFHNFYMHDLGAKWYNGGTLYGAMFALDINWMITPSLSLYGQYIQNEVTAPFVESPDSDDPPTEIGGLLGVKKSFNLSQWGAELYGEFVYLPPYQYILGSPFASYVTMRSVQSGADTYNWIGHPEGRDFMLATIGGTFERNGIIRLLFNLSYLWHGEHGIKWDWHKGSPYNEEIAPNGIVENKIIADFGAIWKPVPRFTFSANVAGIASINNNNISGENDFGAEFSFKAAFVY